MPTGFVADILRRVPAPMVMPAPLVALFRWLEATGATEVVKGEHVALLHADDDRPLGTQMFFQARPASEARAWLPKLPAAADRLFLFARTGGDGSAAGLWLDDAGREHIVHLGSGSGSTFLGVMARTPVDFLRLIAIGYPEICWTHQYKTTPVAEDDDEPLRRHTAYQRWVRSTFKVTIPRTASVIVPEPASMDDDASTDPFNVWMRQHR